MAQWVKDLILSLPWLQFDPWPRNKKKKERKEIVCMSEVRGKWYIFLNNNNLWSSRCGLAVNEPDQHP